MSKLHEKQCYPFGATYAPFTRGKSVPKEQWENDVRLMKELGFSYINVFAAWHKLEPARGRYDFSELDYVMELADRVGLGVSVKVGVFRSFSLYPPRWLMREFRGDEVLDRNGTPVVQGRHRLPCCDDPSYKELASEYLQKLVRHYRDTAALKQWMIWGEPRLDDGCYCPSTRIRFRQWLERKYKSIGCLNDTWSTEGPSDYLDWSEVGIPLTPSTFGGLVPWLDWRNFSDENLTETMAWVHDLFRKIDPDHPTLVELAFKAHDSIRLSNPWKVAKPADTIGLSIFSMDPCPFPDTGNYINSYAMDLMRSVTAAHGKDAWVVEMQAGPVPFSFGDPQLPSARQIALWPWQMIAHGAKGFIVWTFRPRVSDNQGGEFGLIAMDGRKTRRAVELGRVSKITQEYADLFLKAHYKADVAILCSRASDEIVGAMRCGNKNYATGSRIGAYKMLWEENIQTDFISPDLIAEGKADQYKVIILPFALAIDQKVGLELKKFVKNGGVIVADYPCGMKDDLGECYLETPGAGLAEMFGARELDVSDGRKTTVTVKDGEQSYAWRGHLFQYIFELSGGEALGVDEEGQVVCIKNQYGKGWGYLFGTDLFRRYFEKPDKETKNVIMSLLKQASIESLVEVEGVEAQIKDNLELVVLENGNNRLLMAMNHNDVPLEAVITVKNVKGTPYDIINKEELCVDEHKADTSFSLKLDANRSGVINIQVGD